jgi:sugar phosphate isomerase/epimerase
MATGDTILTGDSLIPRPDGLGIALTVPWYRSLWLSSVSDIAVTIDGRPIARQDLRVELGDRSYAVDELQDQWDVLWFIQDRLVVVAPRGQTPGNGSQVDVEVTVDLRLPYMQVAPMTYVTNHAVNRRSFVADAVATSAVPGSDIKLGLSLYSLTSEWAAGRYDLHGLLDTVAAAGIGPGIEIVASQTVRTYPEVTKEFVREWRDAFDRHGFVPSSFGCNLDMGRRRDRDMTLDEEYDFTATQFRSANALGYSLVRIQSAKPELIRRLMPLAEELDLTLGWEIHAPYGPNTPNVMQIRELYDEIDSPRLGFVADFSATMRRMSPTLLRKLAKMGLADEDLERLQEIWAKDSDINERHAEFVAYLHSRNVAPESLGSFARLAFNMHGHIDPREWSDIMPRIVHVHAKFYDIDDDGNEPAIDYPALVREFVNGGYSGFFSSEWEGHAFADLDEADPVDLIRKQHDLIRRSISAALPEGV